jgi:hypothetical protein
MGMFDTFLLPHRGGVQEIQNKSFGCSLDNFQLGDRLDNSTGVRIVTDSFESDVDHVSPLFEQESQWDRGLGVSFVVVDGYWLDYAIYPTRKIANACSKELLQQYQQPAWRAWAWQGIHHLQQQTLLSQENRLLDLMRFVSAFESRKTPRRVKKGSTNALTALFSSWHTQNIPKHTLTWKNLLAETHRLLQHSLQKHLSLPYTLWKLNKTQPFHGYHYDGPEQAAVTGLEAVNALNPDHPIATERLSECLMNLDLGAFESLHAKNPDWFQSTSFTFQSLFITTCAKMSSTLWGSFLWVQLLGLSRITPPERHVYLDGFDVPLALHFSEVLGLEDEWMSDALSINPELLTKGCGLHPIHYLPLNYPKTLAQLGPLDCASLSKDTDDFGRGPLTQALLQAVSTDHAELAFERAQWWLDHGADPNQLDLDGNTPLMALILAVDARVKYEWLWSSQTRHPGLGPSKNVVHTLLQAHSFTHANRKGDTLLSIWPTSEAPREMIQQEEKRRLDALTGVNNLSPAPPLAL